MTTELTKESLNKLKCADLSKLCRDRKLPVSGTKATLIARLLGEAIPKSKPKKSAAVASIPQNKALKVALAQRPAVVIHKNSYGNFEHKETGFVFDKETKKVVGKQQGDTLIHLNMSDLSICKEYKFTVEETCVDKEFSFDQEQTRLKELLKYVEDEEEEDEE